MATGGCSWARNGLHRIPWTCSSGKTTAACVGGRLSAMMGILRSSCLEQGADGSTAFQAGLAHWSVAGPDRASPMNLVLHPGVNAKSRSGQAAGQDPGVASNPVAQQPNGHMRTEILLNRAHPVQGGPSEDAHHGRSVARAQAAVVLPELSAVGRLKPRLRCGRWWSQTRTASGRLVRQHLGMRLLCYDPTGRYSLPDPMVYSTGSLHTKYGLIT